jgi:aspartyl-tRNA(Asn)/glutamyl-tRNA(Gln) amidotransferase subunit A
MLRDAGARIVDISLPHTKYALPAYYVIAPPRRRRTSRAMTACATATAPSSPRATAMTEMYEKTRAEGFGAEVKRRVMIGTYVLSAGFYDAYYNRARKVRTLIKRDFETVFADGVDAILTPATPSAAFASAEMTRADPVEMYLNDVFTVTVNLAGLPGDRGARRARHARPAAWPAADRPALGRGRLLNTAYALELRPLRDRRRGAARLPGGRRAGQRSAGP